MTNHTRDVQSWSTDLLHYWHEFPPAWMTRALWLAIDGELVRRGELEETIDTEPFSPTDLHQHEEK